MFSVLLSMIYGIQEAGGVTFTFKSAAIWDVPESMRNKGITEALSTVTIDTGMT